MGGSNKVAPASEAAGVPTVAPLGELGGASREDGCSRAVHVRPRSSSQTLRLSRPSRLCDCHLLIALGAVVGWLLVLTLVDVLASEPTWLSDAAIAAPSVMLAFLAFEARLMLRSGSPRGAKLPSAAAELTITLVVLHVAIVWYAVLRIVLAPAARRPLEAVHAALLYLMLLGLVLLRWRVSAGLPERVAALEAEVSEQRVQYEAMRALLQRHSDVDEADDSEFEGDEREHLIEPPPPITITDAQKGRPERVLPHVLSGKTFDRARAERIAQRIRKRNYSLGAYYEDVRVAFPELGLYLAQHAPEAKAEGDDGDAQHCTPGVTSGLGADDEYRRTIGAMFAVYWLMRIGLDGERGFSFGVDENWVPHELADARALAETFTEGGDQKSSRGEKSSRRGPSAKDVGGGNAPAASAAAVEKKAATLKEPAKRVAFHAQQDWMRLQQLLVDAGMLVRSPTEMGGVRVDVERTVAMLALTAFHDVMKVQALLPAVAPEHAPYEGFKAADVINDHDVALGYVLDHYSELLPSFSAVTPSDQRTIRFTQSKMGFNHGWLVQGEAPPAPLFAKFKEVMLTEGVAPADVAFYFVHWLTDLAGAEPSPLGGAEKFVLKFPHAVLDSFIRSFAVLNELAVKSETDVMEEYLVRTWGEVVPPTMGPPPSDEDGIAIMRLCLQAQTPDKQSAVLRAYRALPREDMTVLREEMARTGLSGQLFHRGPAFKASFGPAILVYYSPAFVRSLAPAHALEALRVLAEVYRRARQMWPLARSDGAAADAASAASASVTIRIDQIKELKLPDIQSAFSHGQSWLLCRKNDSEGVVERHELDKIPQMAQAVSVLKFWRVDRPDGTASQNGTSQVGSRRAKSVGFFSACSGYSAPSRSGAESPVSAVSSSVPPAALLLEQQLESCALKMGAAPS